jgi:hypothetical protein
LKVGDYLWTLSKPRRTAFVANGANVKPRTYAGESDLEV